MGWDQGPCLAAETGNSILGLPGFNDSWTQVRQFGNVGRLGVSESDDAVADKNSVHR